MTLESILKTVKYGLIGATILTGITLAQDTIHIQGNIKNNPFQTNIKNATITIKDKQGTNLGSTQTDSLGNYTTNFTTTGINDQDPQQIKQYQLSPNYPNPYNPTTNIDFYTPKTGNYTINAYNILGQQITTKQYQLQQGKHTFQITGLGSAGIKILEITGNNIRTTQKMIQLDGNNQTPNIQLITQKNYNPTTLTKNTLTDSIKILFTAPNHHPDSTTVAVTPNITLDYALLQIPTIKNATITGHITNLQTQENVKNANIKITNPDNNNTLINTNTNNSGVFSGNYQYQLWINETDSITNPTNITTTINKNNYQTKTLTQNPQPNTTINETLTNNGVNHQFQITPYDVNGTIIDSLTLHLQKNNGNEIFSKGPNNKININITDYHDEPDTTATLTHLNNDYLQWIIGRTTNQPLDSYNLYQTTRQDNNITSPLIMPTLKFTQLDNTETNMYLIPSKVPNPQQPGQYLTMDGDTVQYMMRRDMPTGQASNSKFMPSDASDTTDCIILTWNYTTGNPVSTEKIQNTKNQYQKILNTYTLENGTQLLNYNLYTIDSFNDPRWQNILAREGDNVAYTKYENIPIPSNGVFYGQPPGRIKGSVSHYSESTTTPTIFSELFEQITGNNDPPGIGTGTTGYVWNPTTQNITDFGKILLRMRSLLNPGTPY